MRPAFIPAPGATAPALTAQLLAFAQAITAAAEPAACAAAFRATPQGGPPRIEIYRHAFRARLTEALRENYPILHKVLGDEAFDQTALGFIAAHPSRRPSIRWFGDELPAYLQGLADTDTDALPHPALPDLARMEWALGTAFDAADDTPLRVEQLLAVAPSAWPALRFTPRASLRLTALQWAVEPLWRALSEDADAQAAAPEPHPHHLLSWCDEDQTRWRSADPLEADLLRAAMAGESFAELCEHASASLGDETAAPVAAAGYLRAWVEAGLLASSANAA